MIPRSKSIPEPHVAGVAPATQAPSWLRRAVGDARSLATHSLADLAAINGAAIASLDMVVRQQPRWAGLWRQRLALTAAAATVRQAGRSEDEALLRDAVLLARPGDDVGPAGHMLLAWQGIAARPVEELPTTKNLGRMLAGFGFAPRDGAVGDLAQEIRRLTQIPGMAEAMTAAVAAGERHGFGPVSGMCVADIVLARRLGWSHALPLLGAEISLRRRSGRQFGSVGAAVATGMEIDGDGTGKLLAAQARAALRAIDLAATLERRAQRLIAVAPKLRAKGSGAVVERLLAQDAMVASQKVAGITDRGLRRLFDRLIEFEAVRELSGRPTFRIYGL